MPSAGDKKPAKAIPSDLLDAYNAYRAASGITRVSKLTATKGQGQKLYRIHEEAGDDAVGLFQWLARSQDGRAPKYREDTRPAETVLRHLDGLLDEVSAKPVSTPHSHPTASARGHEYKTPADRWEGVLQQSGFAAGWHEQIEPEHRARYRAASGAVGGPNALGGITWPPDVKSMKERFNKAYNNYSERK
jgi:hypothetical protein